MHWTWTNPFSVIYQLIGPDMCKAVVLLLLLYWFFAVLLPIIIAQVIMSVFLFR